MSHSQERKEKQCLNCNAVLHGRYCSICGQENLQPQESFWHLVSHFFNDITHFDGKFFSSLKWLILKPGFLTQEYVNGRRASYLNPVRMYLFTSAIFFLIYFSFFSPAEQKHDPGFAMSKADSFHVKAALAHFFIDTSKQVHPDPKKAAGPKSKGVIVAGKSLTETGFRDRAQYDSSPNGSVKDNFLTRVWRHKQFSLKEKYDADDVRMNDQLVENIRHNIPLMFFLSLPLFALFLKLLYIRRKKFYYVAHVIYTLHVYIFIYIAVLGMLIIDMLSDFNYMSWLGWLLWVFIPLTFLYPYRAMHNFYGQGIGKTIFKFALLLAWLIFIMSLLLAAMLFFSILKL